LMIMEYGNITGMEYKQHIIVLPIKIFNKGKRII